LRPDSGRGRRESSAEGVVVGWSDADGETGGPIGGSGEFLDLYNRRGDSKSI
jgi:hypothetical protein